MSRGEELRFMRMSVGLSSRVVSAFADRSASYISLMEADHPNIIADGTSIRSALDGIAKLLIRRGVPREHVYAWYARYGLIPNELQEAGIWSEELGVYDLGDGILDIDDDERVLIGQACALRGESAAELVVKLRAALC